MRTEREQAKAEQNQGTCEQCAADAEQSVFAGAP
jgi:hypothetical protein